MKTQSALFPAVLPALVADAIGLVAMFLLLPNVSERLSQPSGINALLFTGSFLLFCLGVFWLRRLRPMAGGGEWASRGWRIGLAAVFALIMSLAIAWHLGFFRSGLQVDTRTLGEGGSASYFVFGPGAWLGFSAVYILVLGFTVTPSIDPAGGRWPLVATLALLATNIMLLFFSAQARVIVGEAGLWLPLVFALLLVLFLPPRLVYVACGPGFPSPAGYVVLGLFLMLVGAYALAVITA